MQSQHAVVCEIAMGVTLVIAGIGRRKSSSLDVVLGIGLTPYKSPKRYLRDASNEIR